MKIDQILSAAIRGNASDVILKTGAVPKFRFQSKLVGSENGVIITPEKMGEWLQKITPEHIKKTADEADFSYQTPEGDRFRISFFKQRGLYSIVARVVVNHIRTLDELHLPSVLHSLTQELRGIILVTGVTGSGKSTTLAAMLDRINRTRAAHIITIEDPIEYLIRDEMSVVEQREIGIDTISFSVGLRSSLRQNPDVIMVGELRDRETVETAIRAAETGHLVLSTLHSSDAVTAMARITGLFPQGDSHKILSSIGQSLKGIISQRLVPMANGVGMVAACEILIGSPAVRDQISGDKGVAGLRALIRDGAGAYGMQSFDSALASLVTNGTIRKDDALAVATSKSELELLLSGVEK